MDLNQIEYILGIAEEKNISKAAQKLFISQSALNQKLLKLEKEIGGPLFFRTPNKLELTEIGKIYVENAKKIYNIKTSTYNQIADVLNSENRRFSLGVPSGRGITLFTSVYPQFLKLYPHVSISPTEMNCYREQELLSDGKLDLGFLTIGKKQRTSIQYIPLFEEEFFLAVPLSHPLAAGYTRIGNDYPEISLHLFQDEPFVQMYSGSTCRSVTDDIFAEHGFAPRILFETSGAASIPQFVSAGLCCAVVPGFYSRNMEGVRLFRLSDHPVWDLVFGYPRLSYLSKPLKTFIDLSRKFLAPYYPESAAESQEA